MINRLRKYSNVKRKKRFYQGLINLDDLCFDIGANVGAKSKLFLSLGAKVYAFEPQKDCLRRLNTISNSNFKHYPLAVGSINEMKELNIANHSEVATFSQKFIQYFTTDNLQWTKKEKVEVRTLDSLIEEFGKPDFCKIDVEGYEWEILSALTHKIPIIEFEFTGGFMEEARNCILLFENENACFNFNLNENPKFESGQWLNSNDMIKTINLLPTNRLHGNIFVKNR